MSETAKNIIATIGRAPDNTVPVFHPSVAPYHAEIYLHDDMVWLVDKTQGTKTWLKVEGEQWVRFLQGPLFPGDVLRFGQAPDFQIKGIYEKLNLDSSVQQLRRKCQFCGVAESDKKIQSCGSCQGSFVAAIDFDATLNFNNVTATVPIPNEALDRAAAPSSAPAVAPAQAVKAYRKRIRCIVCAAVFLEEIDACPDCGWKHIVYKKEKRK